MSTLPGAKVMDVTSRLERLGKSAGDKVALLVHVGNKDVGKCSHEVVEAKFWLLGKKLKARTSKVAFSEVLPVPHTEM